MANILGGHLGGAPRKYGKDERDRMRKLFIEGKSPRRIAKEIGCSAMTVYREFGMQPHTRLEK